VKERIEISRSERAQLEQRSAEGGLKVEWRSGECHTSRYSVHSQGCGTKSNMRLENENRARPERAGVLLDRDRCKQCAKTRIHGGIVSGVVLRQVKPVQAYDKMDVSNIAVSDTRKQTVLPEPGARAPHCPRPNYRRLAADRAYKLPVASADFWPLRLEGLHRYGRIEVARLAGRIVSCPFRTSLRWFGRGD